MLLGRKPTTNKTNLFGIPAAAIFASLRMCNIMYVATSMSTELWVFSWELYSDLLSCVKSSTSSSLHTCKIMDLTHEESYFDIHPRSIFLSFHQCKIMYLTHIPSYFGIHARTILSSFHICKDHAHSTCYFGIYIRTIFSLSSLHI